VSVARSGKKNVSHGASSRDGEAARAMSSQQQQLDDARETFRPLQLSSGKFNLNTRNQYASPIPRQCNTGRPL